MITTIYYNIDTKEYFYEADLQCFDESYTSLNLPDHIVKIEKEEYVQDPDNLKVVKFGEAYKDENNEWQFDWDTTESIDPVSETIIPEE
jgi:hypothetical protein